MIPVSFWIRHFILLHISSEGPTEEADSMEKIENKTYTILIIIELAMKNGHNYKL